jgi:hypothetical protein
MNKRLNKYLEDNQRLNDIAPYTDENGLTPIEYLRIYFNKGCPRTMYKNGNYQCSGNCNRSFVDLYMLTKAKYPEITMEEVAYILLYVLGHEDNGDKTHDVIKCPGIGMVVFVSPKNIYWRGRYKSFNGKNSKSSYGAARTVGLDGLSYNSILSMANMWIKQQQKLQNGIN